MARFTDKVVLITGGNSGMGRAVAERVAAEGGAVVLGARRKDEGEQAVAAIRAAGGTALFVPTDVTVEAEVAALVSAAVDEFGRLDAAFNNAGGARAFGAVASLDTDAWQADVALNLGGVFYALKYEVPAFWPPAAAASSTTPATSGWSVCPPWRRTSRPSTAWSV
ncbi:SDR family NAD(P)-dependent oxidoreductase [Actinoplanes sp. CA-030573]|uniref:SDR family NAD(P)-dependent oxidoreductase n=1 Tax=Actinoplanes sp. CA-030573 TaxID=3239898 RepID=UPI003D906D0D